MQHMYHSTGCSKSSTQKCLMVHSLLHGIVLLEYKGTAMLTEPDRDTPDLARWLTIPGIKMCCEPRWHTLVGSYMYGTQRTFHGCSTVTAMCRSYYSCHVRVWCSASPACLLCLLFRLPTHPSSGLDASV